MYDLRVMELMQKSDSRRQNASDVIQQEFNSFGITTTFEWDSENYPLHKLTIGDSFKWVGAYPLELWYKAFRFIHEEKLYSDDAIQKNYEVGLNKLKSEG